LLAGSVAGCLGVAVYPAGWGRCETVGHERKGIPEMKNELKTVKRSLLSSFRTQIVAETRERLKSEEYINFSEEQKEAYVQGIVTGFDECASTLKFQGVFKLIID
jgi:hypothetical protein